MSITTTLKKLSASTMALQILLAAKLPIKAKYAVSKLSGAVDRELELSNKLREDVFKNAGCVVAQTDVPVKQLDGTIKMEQRGFWKHDDAEVLKTATKEAEDLMDAEVTVNALPLNLDQFGDGEIDGPAFYGLEWAMKAD